MGLSTPFIRRPVATTLLTFGLAAAGAVAFFKLPVSPLPQGRFSNHFRAGNPAGRKPPGRRDHCRKST
jgi:hypothetical protein